MHVSIFTDISYVTVQKLEVSKIFFSKKYTFIQQGWIKLIKSDSK